MCIALSFWKVLRKPLLSFPQNSSVEDQREGVWLMRKLPPPMYLFTVFTSRLSPKRGPKVVHVVLLSSMLSSQQPCEVGWAETV